MWQASLQLVPGSLSLVCSPLKAPVCRAAHHVPAGAEEVLRNLRAVWISHIHADHHAGLPRSAAASTVVGCLGICAPPGTMTGSLARTCIQRIVLNGHLRGFLISGHDAAKLRHVLRSKPLLLQVLGAMYTRVSASTGRGRLRLQAATPPRRAAGSWLHTSARVWAPAPAGEEVQVAHAGLPGHPVLHAQHRLQRRTWHTPLHLCCCPCCCCMLQIGPHLAQVGSAPTYGAYAALMHASHPIAHNRSEEPDVPVCLQHVLRCAAPMEDIAHTFIDNVGLQGGPGSQKTLNATPGSQQQSKAHPA